MHRLNAERGKREKARSDGPVRGRLTEGRRRWRGRMKDNDRKHVQRKRIVAGKEERIE